MKLIILNSLLFTLFLSPQILAQDSLSFKHLKPYTYTFDIVDGKITGTGANFLEKEAQQNQYILLGEEHNSKRISQFTEAIIPVLDQAGFRTLGMEVGPASAAILTDLSNDPAQTEANLNALNTKYYLKKDGKIPSYFNTTPIPFFRNKSDAKFLATAARHQWKFIGVDQEYAYAYQMLVDRIYENLPKEQQEKNKRLYQETSDSMAVYMKEIVDKTDSRYLSIMKSGLVTKFFRITTANHPENQRIVAGIQASLQVYSDNIIKEYYRSNAGRIEVLKRNLREEFTRIDFDLANEKMLLKMGARHTAKGFGGNSFYDIGNTVSELAAYQGNNSLHIYFMTRFDLDGDQEVDQLDSNNPWHVQYKVLMQMAKKEQWTIIDLRPIKELVFYNGKKGNASTNAGITKLIEKYDILILPNQAIKTEWNLNVN